MEDKSDPAPSATAQTEDPSGDFGHATPRENITPVDLSSSRIAVLYEASSSFECALAATLKCEKAIAALSADTTDYGIVAADLLSVNPHAIIILNSQWSRDLYARIGELMASKPCMLIALGSASKEQGASASVPFGPQSIPEPIYLEPALFAKIAPCRGEVSAFIIFSHLMRGEFPRAFHDGLEDARFFRLAIRASTRSTLEAWQLVNDIILDWQRVMEPDNMVMYGRFIANVGPSIAQKRVENHSVVIALSCPEAPRRLVRVVECPDFEEPTGNVALTTSFGPHKIAAAIIYSLSADTTICRLVCHVPTQDQAEARAILAQLTPNLPKTGTIPSGILEVSMSTNDFFAIIRKSIVTPRDELAPEVLKVIKEGEQALKDTIAASKTP